MSTTGQALTAPPPPNGNIFDRLDRYGVSWRDYYSDVPSILILLAYGSASQNASKLVPIAQFFDDVASDSLSGVSLVDPAFERGESEENPDDIRVGELFASRGSCPGPAG